MISFHHSKSYLKLALYFQEIVRINLSPEGALGKLHLHFHLLESSVQRPLVRDWVRIRMV